MILIASACAYHACVRMHAHMRMCVNSVGCASDWRTGYHRFALQVQHHFNVAMDHEIFFFTSMSKQLLYVKNKQTNFEHQNYSCEEYKGIYDP